MKISFILSILFFSIVGISFSQTFTYGNLVALQAGDGTTALSSTGTPIFLREFTPTGSATVTYSVPTNSNTLVISGSATSDGQLSLSNDNRFLVLAGYNASVNATGVASANGSVAPRTVAWVNSNGAINYTSSTTFMSGNNLRAATSDGLGNFWGAGGTSGTCYFGIASAASAVQTTSLNNRYVLANNSGLFFCTGSSPSGIFKVGTGLPTTSGQTNTLIINTSTVGASPSPYAFSFDPTFNICYVADDRSIANGGGIQKWVNASGTWTLAYTFSTSPTSIVTVGARGVTADFSGSNPIIYGTSAEASLNRVFKIIDGGSVSSSTITTLATSTTNTIFRGIAFSPTTCPTPSISSLTSNTLICGTQSLGLSVTAGGGSVFSYSWSGPGSLSSNSISNPILSSPVAGDYSVSVNNGCGIANAVVSISISANPTLSVNSPTVCFGNSTTLSASGANNYTWSNGSNTPTTIVSPTINTTYTILGSSTAGCLATSTVNVFVNSLPLVSLNSSTVCIGSQASLTANGATTYTWNNGSNGSTIAVSPTVNSTYTVSGTDNNNCINSATTIVNVIANPSLMVTSSTVCEGQTVTLTASGATSYSWSNGVYASSISVSPLTSTVYNVSGALSGCIGSGNASVSVLSNPTITVNSASTCIGGTLSLNANGATSYTWNNNSNSASIIISPSASIVYTVTGSTNGCVSQSTSSVTVYSLPTITINSASVCVGSSAILLGSGATSYSWNTGITNSSLIVTPSITSTYTIYGISSQGCVGSNTSQILVNPLPSISVPAFTICLGSTATITASGASTYTWNTTDNTTSIVVSPSVNTSYTVSGTSSLGCVNSQTTSVSINASLSIVVNSLNICVGNAATLIANGANTYTWNTGSNSNSIIISPTVNTNYTVSGTNGSGCSGTSTTNIIVNTYPTLTVNLATVCPTFPATLIASGANTYSWSTSSTNTSIVVSPSITNIYTVTGNSSGCITSLTTQVLVNPSPSITVSSSTICIGGNATLTVNGASSYTWNTGSNASLVVVSPSVTTIYSISATSSLGCVGSNTTNVLVYSNPTITINAATICVGSTASLSANGANTYTWSTSSNSSSITTSPLVNTIYTLSGTSSVGCISSASTNVIVNSLPTISVNSATICAGATATLFTSGASSYTWSNGSNTSSIAISPNINTTYSVSGTSLAGCTTTSNASVIINALPSITINTATICTGQTAILIANGANTYSWNTSSTNSSITVSPSLTTNYSVIATSSLGCSKVFTTQVIVNPIPTITINSSTICNGQTATLTVSGASSYSWNTGASTASILINPTATTVYSVTGTSASCSISNTSTVLVNPLPVILVPTINICSGGSATISASGASTYTWNTSSNNSSFVVTPTSNINYTVTGTSSLGCVGSSTTAINITTAPIITVNNLSVCAGNSATIIASGLTTYTWSNGVNSASLIVTPTSSAVYTVSGNASGCPLLVTNTVALTYNPLPTLTVNSATICNGASTIITANGATNYTWSNNLTTPTINVSPSITTVYSVSGTSSLGCSNTASVNVLVTPAPSITVNSASLCAGSSATLNASGVSTYTWSSGANSSSIIVTPTLVATLIYTITGNIVGCSITAASTATILVSPLPILNVTSASVCAGNPTTLNVLGANSYTWNNGSTSSSIVVNPINTTSYTIIGQQGACINYTTTTVTVNALPLVSINSSTSICRGNTFNLIATGANNYTWSTGANSSSISISPSVSSTYSVIGVSAQGCSNVAYANVTVNALPSVSLSLSKNILCKNDAPTIAYVGTPSGGSLTGLPSSSLQVGTYTVVYTFSDNNGCSCFDSKTYTVNACTDILTSSNSNLFVKIYPNPVKDVLNISFNNNAKNVTIVIMDLKGLIFHSIQSSDSVIKIDTSNLVEGLYIFKIELDNEFQFLKFVKE